jgi:hypothetical protein
MVYKETGSVDLGARIDAKMKISVGLFEAFVGEVVDLAVVYAGED